MWAVRGIVGVAGYLYVYIEYTELGLGRPFVSHGGSSPLPFTTGGTVTHGGKRRLFGPPAHVVYLATPAHSIP